MAKTIHNRDINVPEELSAQFPQLRRLLDNPEINKELENPEAIANQSKLFFNIFGLSSLIFVVLMLLITAWRPFLYEVGIEAPVWLLWSSAVLGFLSFAMSLCSGLIFRFQGKWLYNRFVTERLRQWKFQQLLDGSFVGLSATDPARFENELEARWVKARFDVLEKAGTMNDFLDAENFQLFVEPSACPDQDLTRQLLESYQLLRLDYQAKYFSFKKGMLGTLDIWTSGIAQFTFLIAGLLALSEIVAGFLIRGDERGSKLFWVFGVSALTAALISVAIRIVRSARAISEEAERYTSKWVLLKTLAERFKKESDPTKQLECMIETERVCVEELREFIRTFRKSDYLL